MKSGLHIEKNKRMRRNAGENIIKDYRNNQSISLAKRIGIELGGTILFPYVYWVLEQANKMDIHRLYFVARDGYVLKEIADTIIQHKNLDIETSYIYGSRRAWRLPSLNEEFDIFLLLEASSIHKIDSVKKLASVFGLDVQEIKKYLPYNYANEMDKLSLYDIKNIAFALSESREFRREVVLKQIREKELVVKYMQQKIDFEEDNFAFVELSGTGYTQECLANLLSEVLKQKSRNFFFRMEREIESEVCEFYVFIKEFIEHGYIIEALCRAPHGQCIGYQEIEGKIVPKLERLEGLAIQEHGFDDYLKGVLEITEELEEKSESMGIEDSLIDGAKRALVNMINTPDKNVLEYIATMPLEATGHSNKVKQLAPKFSKEELNAIYGINDGVIVDTGFCLPYSLLRCSAEDREYIEECKRQKKEYEAKMQYIIPKQFSVAEKYRLPLGSRVIIYGAGKVGNLLQNKIIEESINLVAWVDKNYNRYSDEIESVESIQNYDFDIILIAVMNSNIAEEIRKDLIAMNIPARKICWIELREWMEKK